LSRILGNELTNEISRYYFGAESKFPWIADSTDFPAKVKIIYNSVGGSELINFPEPQKKLALSKLRNANYLSVRDIFTAEVLLNNSVTNVYTTPDSAVLMSEQYPIESLENKISNNTRQLLKNMKYVCFHSNYKYLIKNINHISEELKTIHKRYGLEIVLLPIGRYVGLDDFKGLKELKNNLNIRCTLMENNLSIWEIMYTIASAKLFIGTSLHGNVTSQAFCVPHIGLSSKQSKLDYYLKTWDIEAQSSCTKANNISEKAEKVLEIPSSVHLENKITLIKATKENFHRISDAILRT
jgi:polysaccharide pyruvyl transferase WcaK-like protein